MKSIETRLQDTLKDTSASASALVEVGGEALMAVGLWGEGIDLIKPAETALNRAVQIENGKLLKRRLAAYHAARTFLPFVSSVRNIAQGEPVTRYQLCEIQQGITGALQEAVAVASDGSQSRAVSTNVYQLLLARHSLRKDADQVHIAFPAPPSTSAYEWHADGVDYPACDVFVTSNGRDEVAGSSQVVPTQVRSHLQHPPMSYADLYPNTYMLNMGLVLAAGIQRVFPEQYPQLSYASGLSESKVQALKGSRATLLTARMLINQEAGSEQILGDDDYFLDREAEYLTLSFDKAFPSLVDISEQEMARV